MTQPKHIIALEIGSSKIRGASGTYDPLTDKVSIKAVEEEKLVDCVRYGCIQNVAEVTNRVRLIIDRLESRDPRHHITGVYVGIGGRSVSAISTVIERRFANETEITRNIIESIYNEARATAFSDRDVIDVTPREFRVDGSHVARPEGTIGRSIQATLNLITAKTQLKRNINSVIRDRLMLNLNGCVVRQLAVANLVLSLEDLRLGCMLVDFGAETTTVSIYRGGNLQYLATIPMGSRNITIDITHLNHLEENAEIMKKRNGNAMPTTTAAYNQFDPAGHYGGDFVELNNYVVARAGEIIENINAQLKYANMDASKIPSGIILVGNGAQLRGFNERLQETVGVKVRVGTPMNIEFQDQNIHLTEAVDVLAILHAAAVAGGKDCTEPVQHADAEPIADPYQEKTPAHATSHPAGTADNLHDPIGESDPIDDPSPKTMRNGLGSSTPPKPKRSGFGTKFWERTRERLMDMMSEKDEFDSIDS